MSKPSEEATRAATPARDVFVTGRRMAACPIDCLLATVPSLLAFAPLLFVESGPVVVLVLLLLFVLLFCAFYVAYVAMLDGFRGRTLEVWPKSPRELVA